MRLSAVWPVLVFVVVIIVIDEFISFFITLFSPIVPGLDIFEGKSILDWLMRMFRSFVQLFFKTIHLMFMIPGVAIGEFTNDEIVNASADVITQLSDLVAEIISPIIDDVQDTFWDIFCIVVFGGPSYLVLKMLFPDLTEEEKIQREKDFKERMRTLKVRRG